MTGRFIRRIPVDAHYFLSSVLAVVIVPAFKIVHLPVAANWHHLIPLFWISLTARSILAAVILVAVGLPARNGIKPLWSHFITQKPRLFFFAVFSGWALWKFGVHGGLVLIAIAVVLTEVIDRSQGNLQTIGRWIGSVIPPAAYFFLGLILVFAYNDLVAAVKDPGGYDWLFLRIDSYILHGHTISNVARTALLELPSRLFSLSEAVYYGMFDQIGAAILLISFLLGTKQALRFVGTMLTAYYLALLLFYLWPSMGPFYTCPGHFAHFPQWSSTYASQQGEIWKAKLLSSPYKVLSRVDTDYFIAFPCLHLAQPLIVLWFMRRWKRIVLCLVVYDVILIPAILLLEWHYVVDLLGGVVVAVIAILLNPGSDEASISHQPTIPQARFETKQNESLEIICSSPVSAP